MFSSPAVIDFICSSVASISSLVTFSFGQMPHGFYFRGVLVVRHTNEQAFGYASCFFAMTSMISTCKHLVSYFLGY
ncbi:hypothetical protein QBC45DRAFT_411229 [Copromyces sp. CBS 386.78]|nr:hypothetical protein QBC45DRAFT_411229 [Copromyces sp. CBS 386.78]